MTKDNTLCHPLRLPMLQVVWRHPDSRELLQDEGAAGGEADAHHEVAGGRPRNRRQVRTPETPIPLLPCVK